MGLTNVAGVFSRYFIVGFFLPAFFALIVLAQVIDADTLPTVYEQAKGAGRVAIVGGAALLVGLLLLGLHYPVLRWCEGYPLEARGDRWYARFAYTRLLNRQKDRLRRAREATEDPNVTEGQRRDATWRLDLQFPHDQADLLLPTSFGNALRAFERHARIRWGLNSIGAWPRIELLLTPQESQVHADATGDVAFFVNGSLMALLAGAAILVDGIAGAPHAWWSWALMPLPFVLSALLWHASIGAVIQWGHAVRASMDIHRLELYERLGVRAPEDFSDERDVITPQVNAMLLRGVHMDDTLARREARSGAHAAEDGLPNAARTYTFTLQLPGNHRKEPHHADPERPQPGPAAHQPASGPEHPDAGSGSSRQSGRRLT